MTDKTTWLLQHPYTEFVLGLKAAWEGELSSDAFNHLFAQTCVCHMQGNELNSAQAFQEFIQSVRLNITNLKLIPESIIVQNHTLHLFHRWKADRWHDDVIAGGEYSNFCQIAMRISDGKIVELWQQAQNFLFLLGPPLSEERLSYPAWQHRLLVKENGFLHTACDEQSIRMNERAKQLVDVVFGHGALRQIDSLLHPALTFYNGDITGHGIAEWKSFIYALRTAIGKEGVTLFDELFIRDRNTLTLFVRMELIQASPFVLSSLNGMFCVLKLEMDDRYITKIQTYPENYLFFLGLDFPQHETRLKQLFRGQRLPLETKSRLKNDAEVKIPSSPKSVQNEQVAVVGIAGRFPQADSVAQFWNNLLEGKSGFSAFPEDRPWLSAGTIIRFAGFMNDIFRFDEQYFQIPPTVAQYMDPQHRLLLETIIQSIEDSGHANQDVSGDRTALFVSALSNDYEKLLRDKDVEENFYYWAGNEPAMSSGRIARFLDIQGSTQFINTECTGGITALLGACDLIRSGQADQAIVSATSLFLHPYGFIAREDGILSPAAAPELFSKRSKGQLRGEAVVSVVLKSLPKAQQDGDDIYAIIAGGAANNSGRTFSLISANVEQQAKTIRKAWQNAGVSADDFSVIECNASGVRAGDFTEITALKKVFLPDHHIDLSTVKGAIGHTEAVSGLVALVKVLLQLRHQTIIGIQGLSEIDDSLAIERSGLYLNHQNKKWGSTTREGDTLPRIAGINSFAGGGYNTHVVVKEFIGQKHTHAKQATLVFIPLSSHSEASLRDHIVQIKRYLQEQDLQKQHVDLARLAFTLQSREARQYRVILGASHLSELISQLDSVLNGDIFIQNVGEPRQEEALRSVLQTQQSLSSSLADEMIPELLLRWLRGEKPDWSHLWGNTFPCRLSGLPVRAFLGDIHYPPFSTGGSTTPLNTPLNDEQKTCLFRVNATEPYLCEHVVNGQMVLPGVVHLEFVRHTAMLLRSDSAENAGIPSVTNLSATNQLSLRNVGWAKPVIMAETEQTLALTVNIKPETSFEEESVFSFGVALGTAKHEEADGWYSDPFTVGSIVFSPLQHRPSLDIEQYQQYCQERRLTTAQCYGVLSLLGIQIGAQHQAIQEVTIGKTPNGDTAVLAKLAFIADNAPVYEFAHQSMPFKSIPFTLCPAIMDGALQAACLGLLTTEDLKQGVVTPIPFAVDEISVIRPVKDEAWAWVTGSASSVSQSPIRKMDIVICDNNGAVCVAIKGFSTRERVREQRVSVGSHAVLQTEDHQPPEQNQPVPETIIGQLKAIIGKELGIASTQLRTSEPLDKYGIDSAIAVQLVAVLEKTFGSLPKTLFYEYKCIADIAHYLAQTVTHHADNSLLPVEKEPECCKPSVNQRQNTADNRLNIAIIGISAKYSQSENIAQIWDNLKQGKRCISEIPEDRWDWRHYYHENKQNTHTGSHFSKWGGFLDSVDEFDFAFFDISENEAAAMDPQERLFLQEAWKAIEDAGYTPETLAADGKREKDGIKAVGVYVGSMYSEYQLHDVTSDELEQPVGLVGSQASIANRFSYFMDFHGPSITLDAMCTSSMVAIQLACQDLKQGRINAAVVGGVNLTLHPNKYLTLSRRKMLSSAPELNSFGEGGNGYIPGEGIGVLVLKRLEDALNEGAHIYGVIQGCAVNQNGRSNGFGAPEPKAQQVVIEQAMTEAGVNADEISYVEAHSTGTRYGDLIEVGALTKAFQKRSGNRHFACLIGSGKPNFGHCEAASGVGSVIKVLLQMQHKAIAPTLYGERLNPDIIFEQTPFSINSALMEWRQDNGEGMNMPRIAGISCFGAGGTNAHLILQENERPEQPETEINLPCVILLSAKTVNALQERVKQLYAFLSLYQSESSGNGTELVLARLAFTLQVGRESMPVRTGFLVQSLDDLCQQLKRCECSSENIIAPGNADQFEKGVWQEKINGWLAENNQRELLSAWIKGANIEWRRLYRNRLPGRISLPVYSFERCKIELKAVETALSLPTSTHDVHLSADNGFAFLSDRTMALREKAERFVVRTLENIIGHEIPSVNTPFSTLHLTSLHIVRFLDFWQVVFGVSLQFTIFYEQRNVRALVDDLLTGKRLTEEQIAAAAAFLLPSAEENSAQAFPLSELQESFVIGRALSTYGQRVGSTLYFELHIARSISLKQIESAWNHLVDHHESLHTVVNHDFQQQVLEDYAYHSLPVIDLTEYSDSEKADYLTNSRAALNCKVFDLARWPYFEIRAFIVDTEHTVVQIALDEVITDAASVFLLIEQWHHLSEDPEYELPATYSLRKYLTLVEQIRTGEHFQHSMQYWIDKLDDISPGPELKYHLAQYPVQQTVHCLSAELDHELWSAIKTQADMWSCSTGAVLLSVFCEVLHQFTEQPRFSLNLTNFNRLAINQQINGLVGLLANSNIFVSEWQPEHTFQSRVMACQQQLDRDANHSFVGAVNVLRKLRQNPAKRADIRLPVVFTNLISSAFQQPDPAGGWSIQHMMNTTPQVALDHHVFEVNGRLVYRWYVAHALLEQGSVITLFDAYRQKLIARARSVSEKAHNNSFPMLGIQKALYAGQMMPVKRGGKVCCCHLEFDIDVLDIPRLARAWNDVVAYHPVLRTRYLTSLHQGVLDKVPDYTILTESVIGTEDTFHQRCNEIRNEMLLTHYSAGEYPGYRIRVCTLGGQKNRLFVNFDFVLIDGKSIFLILNQLFNKYKSEVYRLPVQNITFQDVVLHYKHQQSALACSTARDYWHDKFSRMRQGLNGLTPVAQQQASLPAQFTQVLPYYRQIQALAEKLGVSVDSILLAAFGLTVLNWHRLKTGEHEPITIAVVSWDRYAELLETTTGVFTRLSWVSFSDVDTDQTSERLILRVQAQLDKDRHYSSVDELEVAAHYPNLHFPIVYTCLLAYGTNFPEPIYSVSQTPGVVLDNISTVLNSSYLRLQWDMLESGRNEFSTVFQQYCSCLKKWLFTDEMLNFGHQEKGIADYYVRDSATVDGMPS
ncbi:polyketide synthase dehydratase domain-containing protein [Xenorhabdus budapestensis]|uniref:Polyketide synthase dehydratase domain-containing protein n=1 Tax=Xenorhabdus budapestensis TaxID=290110 RepID=A0ABX7VCM2_XENBU|nr:beta-ketoacyl synthase N-terminal-like domain-containing protein [Xenorhabdus budapestensis]QTL38543.1 polyketide synthase dehydratase domain-containing protein [Xenorhabdus budapestensis]